MMGKQKVASSFRGQKAIAIPRDIITRYCDKNPLISILYLTDIGYYPKARYHYCSRPGGADQHILIYCDQGEGFLILNDERTRVGPNEFIIIPKNLAHTYRANNRNPWSIYWIHFNGAGSDAMVNLIRQRTGDYKGAIRFDDKVIGMFNEMYQSLEHGYSLDNLINSNLYLPHFLTAFVFNERVESIPGSRPPDLVDQVVGIMKDQVEEELTLSKIASSVNLSVSRLSTLFRRKTGFPPMHYFNHLKVQKACQYLQFTNMRIKEISSLVGINDPHYFTRLFSRIIGQSPTEYRALWESVNKQEPLEG